MGANSFQECYVREWESLVFFSNEFHSLGCRCGVVGKQRMGPGGASVAFCSHQVGTWWSVDLKMNPWSTARLFLLSERSKLKQFENIYRATIHACRSDYWSEMAEMERTASPALGRQRSVSSGGPTLLHSRSHSRHEPGSGSFNSLRRGQNYAAKAAAARLAQVSDRVVFEHKFWQCVFL